MITSKSFLKPAFSDSALYQFESSQWKLKEGPSTSFAFDLDNDKFDDLILVKTESEKGSVWQTKAVVTACLYRKGKSSCQLSTAPFKGDGKTNLVFWAGKIDESGVLVLRGSDIGSGEVIRKFKISNNVLVPI